MQRTAGASAETENPPFPPLSPVQVQKTKTMKTKHTQNLIAAALTGALALATTVAQAGEIGHYAGGFMNMRDYFVPEPGFYGAVYNYFYTTDRLNDRNGNKVNSVTFNPGGGPGVTLGVDVNVDMYVLAPSLIYVTDIKSLGIKYGALITPTFANASLEGALSTASGHGGTAEGSTFDVADMF